MSAGYNNPEYFRDGELWRVAHVASGADPTSAAESSAPAWSWSSVMSVTGVSFRLRSYTIEITVPRAEILVSRLCVWPGLAARSSLRQSLAHEIGMPDLLTTVTDAR